MAQDTKIVPARDSFKIDTDNSSGLSVLVRGGAYIDPQQGYRSTQNKTLTLTASATNYVEMNGAGVISANTTGFTNGYTPLYVVTTGTALVSGVEDCRGAVDNGARKTQAMIANGAIREDAELVTLSKTGVLAATIAAPAAGRRLVITQVDAGTDGHTVTLAAGTWNGTNAIATLNAAGESLDVIGVSATRFLIITNVGAVAFS